MKQLLRIWMIPAVLLMLGTAAAPTLAGGCKKHGRCNVDGCLSSHTPEGCPPYWCDPYTDLNPWPFDNPLYDGPRNWTWWFPDGGFTAYPGLPGSGIQLGSDYSHINWVVPPTTTAELVRQKLDSLGIPLVPQETLFYRKNPRALDNAKLPLPKSWMADPDPDRDQPNPNPPDKDRDLDR